MSAGAPPLTPQGDSAGQERPAGERREDSQSGWWPWQWFKEHTSDPLLEKWHELENLISIMHPQYERVFARMMPFNYTDLGEVDQTGSSIYRSDCSGGPPFGVLSMSPRAGKTRVFLFFAELWLKENPRGFCVVGAVQAGSRDLWIKEAHKIGMAHRVRVVGSKQECPQEPGNIYVMLHRQLRDCVRVPDTPVLMGIDESHCMSVELCTKVQHLISSLKTISLVCISLA